jgi:hypothetical protein
LTSLGSYAGMRLTWRRGAAALKADLANMVMVKTVMGWFQLVPIEVV